MQPAEIIPTLTKNVSPEVLQNREIIRSIDNLEKSILIMLHTNALTTNYIDTKEISRLFHIERNRYKKQFP